MMSSRIGILAGQAQRRSLLSSFQHTTNRNASFLSKLKPKFTLPSLKLIPQPPGHIVGTVNDAYVPPPPDFYHGSYHWSYEKLVTLGMVPLMMTPFVYGTGFAGMPVLDATLSCLLLWHCKAGFESCIIDYIPKRVYGFWHNAAMRLLQLGSFISLYGVYVIETEHNGLINLIISLWGA